MAALDLSQLEPGQIEAACIEGNLNCTDSESRCILFKKISSICSKSYRFNDHFRKGWNSPLLVKYFFKNFLHLHTVFRAFN